jgi:hypothetical protein
MIDETRTTRIERMTPTMKMKTRILSQGIRSTAGLLMAAALGGSAWAAGPLPPRTDINPALLYWQSFSLHPELADDVKKDFLSYPPRLPLADAEPILKKYDGAFKYLRRAAAMSAPCDWGIDLADGPETLMPNLIKIRQSTHVAAARAHYELEAGRDQDAVDDLGAVLVLGRNSATDGTLVSTMIGYAVERQVNDFVAMNLYRFGPKALISLTQKIESAPPRRTVKQAMRIEQTAFWNWFIMRIESMQRAHPNDDAAALQEARALLEGTLDKGKTVDQILEASGRTTAGLLDYFRQVGPIYDSIVKLADAAPNRVEEDARAAATLTKDHPNLIARLILPNIGKARTTELGGLARVAMLRAAIALRLEGEDGFKKVQDPFGDGPFTLTRLPADSGEVGYQLSSHLDAVLPGNTTMKFFEDAPKPKAPAFE